MEFVAAQITKTNYTERYPTNGKFALFGKSSGGYGALHNAIHHAGEWNAIASHSGDVGLMCYTDQLSNYRDSDKPTRNLDNFLNMSRTVVN